jgi:hypothetical protein
MGIGDLDGNGRPDVVLVNGASSSVSVLLGRGKSEAELVASPARCELGANLTLTATLVSVAPGGYVPTGTVRLFDGFTLLGSAPAVNGVATLQLPAPYNSTRTLTAEYGGDRRFHGSISVPIEIEVFTTSVGVPDVREGSFGLERIRPNPVLGNVGTLRFELPISSSVRFELFDVRGRRVFERDLGELGPGPHTAELPGLNALTPGLYFVRLVQGSRAAVSRFTLLRTPPG